MVIYVVHITWAGGGDVQSFRLKSAINSAVLPLYLSDDIPLWGLDTQLRKYVICKLALHYIKVQYIQSWQWSKGNNMDHTVFWQVFTCIHWTQKTLISCLPLINLKTLHLTKLIIHTLKQGWWLSRYNLRLEASFCTLMGCEGPLQNVDIWWAGHGNQSLLPGHTGERGKD